MRLIHGRLDYAAGWEYPNVYLFTGNPIRRKDGAIVMGRGAAKQCRDLFPGVDKTYGDIIKQEPHRNIMWADVGPRQRLGWFKVKDHWGEPADLGLIKNSVASLHMVASLYDGLEFHMNFPGIGNGGLAEEDVLPVLQILPDNVLIYK